MDSWPIIPLAFGTENDSLSSDTDAEREGEGIDVSALFSAVVLPQENPPECLESTRGLASQTAEAPPGNLSHAKLLQAALTVSGVRANLPKRRRRPGKVSFDARVLLQLETNPSRVQRRKPLDRQEHKAGFHEFRRWYISQSGCSWRDGEQQSLKQWSCLTNNEKYHWLVVRKASVQCGNAALLKASPSQLRKASGPGYPAAEGAPDNVNQSGEEDSIAAVGLLVTYFPKIGTDDPDVGVWVRQGWRGAALRDKLLTKPAYRIYFEAFVSFLKEFRDEHKFHSVAACMELGEDSRFAARVHLHAYIGFLQKDGAAAGLRSVKVRKSDLIFCGSTPYVVATKGRNGKRLHEAVAQGMYYVAGPKSTCMLRFTDLEPIEEVKISDTFIETS